MRQSFEVATADLERGLIEASLFLDGRGAIHETLRTIALRLDKAGICFATAGALAMFAHGYRRYTQSIDLLVSAEGLIHVHEAIIGADYEQCFSGSKSVRDLETGVSIKFLVSGKCAGAGSEMPWCFPLPEAVTELRNGICYLTLPALVEMKLAAGIANRDRLKDLGDTQEMIKALELPCELSFQLDPYVRTKFQELWRGVRVTSRYRRFWRLRVETNLQLAAMQADGVVLEQAGGPTENDVCLVTYDWDIARKYDMHYESEFLPEWLARRS